jgi:Na+-transporting NADH:ubiquinone oxidoreductase subunit NqrF
VSDIDNRALLLLGMLKPQDLAEPGSKDYMRWQNVKRKRVRITTEEIDALAKAFPNYRWWLLTGDVMPEVGQTSPEYDAAHSASPSQSAG